MNGCHSTLPREDFVLKNLQSSEGVRNGVCPCVSLCVCVCMFVRVCTHLCKEKIYIIPSKISSSSNCFSLWKIST